MFFKDHVSTRKTSPKKTHKMTKLKKDNKILYVLKCTNQIIHNKQSYIKWIALEMTCCGSIL
jgi:hypothetical protein